MENSTNKHRLATAGVVVGVSTVGLLLAIIAFSRSTDSTYAAPQSEPHRLSTASSHRLDDSPSPTPASSTSTSQLPAPTPTQSQSPASEVPPSPSLQPTPTETPSESPHSDPILTPHPTQEHLTESQDLTMSIDPLPTTEPTYEPMSEPEPEPTPSPTQVPMVSRSAFPSSVNLESCIGTLHLGGRSVSVYYSDSQSRLDKRNSAICQPAKSLPWQGSALIADHNHQEFDALYDLHVGDIFSLETNWGTLVYRVTYIGHALATEDYSALYTDSGVDVVTVLDDLALYTCYPRGSMVTSRHRLVVLACCINKS